MSSVSEEKKSIKVKFGLEAQGHIPTIEAELKRWNDNNEYRNDMTYSTAVWESIGKKIGWHPFSAALNYFEYLDEKKTNKTKMSKLQEIKNICDGIEYSRDVPEEAKRIAKENNIIIIVGGSDDFMYCYGADCYLTDYVEHSYGWDGDTLKYIDDKNLQKEAEQLGLMIWWCGEIVDEGLKIDGYDTKESGAFSYSVNESIESLDFKVLEDYTNRDVYCTGKIIQLPKNFKPQLEL